MECQKILELMSELKLAGKHALRRFAGVRFGSITGPYSPQSALRRSATSGHSGGFANTPAIILTCDVPLSLSPMLAAAVRERLGSAQTSPGGADQDDRDQCGGTQTADHDQHVHDVHRFLFPKGWNLRAGTPGLPRVRLAGGPEKQEN